MFLSHELDPQHVLFLHGTSWRICGIATQIKRLSVLFKRKEYTADMHAISQERQGEFAILCSAVLWSLFPIVTILTFITVHPLYSVAVSTLVSAVFFAIVLTVKHEWVFIRDYRAWKPIVLNAFFIGILFYGLLFIGLQYTTAGNGAIISLMEVFFSFVILGVFIQHEKPEGSRIIGGLCMFIGAAIVLIPRASGWNMGDVMILLATTIAPIGNKYAQDARRFVSASFILFWRSILSGTFLYLVALIFSPMPTVHDYKLSLAFLIINGFLFLGLSKILWIESVHRLPITTVVSIESISPFLTLVVSYFFLHEHIQIVQITGLIPILLGMFLLTRHSKPV